MRKLYLDKWDNYDDNSPKRMEAVQEVIEVVNDEGGCYVSFDYDGRTRHMIAAEVMKEMLPKNFITEIGYNYLFKITKNKHYRRLSKEESI